MLEEFFRGENRGEIVVGTYLYPHTYLRTPDSANPYSLTSIVDVVEVGDLEVLVSINGGLFVRPPEELVLDDPVAPLSAVQFHAKFSFEERVARAFNMLICELSLNGVTSAPATPVHISAGRLIENHALIMSAAGNSAIERTLAPALHLLTNTWGHYTWCQPESLETAAKLTCANKLASLSQNLPTFVAGAYSLYSQRQLSEALIDAWIAIEQIIDSYWESYISQMDENGRRARLRDTRSYTAAVRTEVLFTAGKIPASLYKDWNTSRKHRNALSHRAQIELKAARETVMALKETIEFFCGETVSVPLLSQSINW